MRYKTVILLAVMPCYLSAFGTEPKAYENAAKDSRESPHIKQLVVSTTDKDLVLRFEPNPDLGRRDKVVRRNTGDSFHHAQTQLIVTLNNEALDEQTVSVGVDESGNVKVFPAEAAARIDEQAVTITYPLSKVQYSPVLVTAEILSLYYADENVMVAGEGRNLFAAKDGPAKVEIAGLSAKPELPEIRNVNVAEVTSASVTIEWETSNRTDVSIRLTAADQPARELHQDFRTRRHRITLTDLAPATEYQAVVSGTDFAGRSTASAAVKFRTEPMKALKGKNNAWLRVKGKYVVDSSGKPFPLGAYSQFIGEYWYNEFPRYGTMALTARYYRNLGLNALRLGLCSYIPNHWSAGISRDEDLFQKWGGPEGYVKEFLRPMIDPVMDEGIYVIIDWHWTYGMTPEYIEQIAQFWEACAKEFKDEPRVAMYQLINEPCFHDGTNRPDLGPRIRDITKDMIQRIRKHDKRHIVLVSDWNCGWGWATESQWAGVNFDVGDPQKQVVFSKHISREHCTEAFMAGGVDRVADKYDVPIFFDEVESSSLMGWQDHLWFYGFLSRNPRKYGFGTWVAGQYWPEFPLVTASFAQSYLPRSGFAEDTRPIVQWWRMDTPQVEQKDGVTYFTYDMPRKLFPGDYGIVIDNLDMTRRCQLAIKPRKKLPRLLGTWLGHPGAAVWLNCPFTTTQESAVPNATYFHALTGFEQIVLKTTSTFDTPPGIQMFRLNPKHQMPRPKVETTAVE